ncbi:MAG: L-aspartate oxidase [Clostridia bacterium]|nr:L-aspartate oxidase [Clostridia bacterium]
MDSYRYLVNFDTDNLEKVYSDIIIIGSGIAGVYTALTLDSKYNISILTKDKVEISNSVLAQGGIAVSLDKDDSPDMHMADTLNAGAGLCNESTVRVLVDEAAENIDRLCKLGVDFDKSSKDSNTLALTREAAHSTRRIIHAGDATGKEVCDKLIQRVSERKNVHIHEQIWVVDLLVKDNRCYGVLIYDESSKEYKVYYAGLVICASGGYGNLYQYTTNPDVSTGDGAAFSYRAGAELMDLEFVQFHPTVLYHKENRSFLISEAVRGEGAYLKNGKGERFMDNYHEKAELAPRDVVARSIFLEMQKNGEKNAYLDIRYKGREYLEKRFPMIFATCMKYGIDMSKDFIPIAPAEHYCMGGIKTDVYGKTSIKGFYACGEAACNGIHGANRLASNSLLEGLVFGHRIGVEAEEILADFDGNFPRFVCDAERKPALNEEDIKKYISSIRESMTHNVGIIRNEENMTKALKLVREIKEKITGTENTCVEAFILQNNVLLAEALITSAIERKESRGAHYRLDYPYTDDQNWKRNIIRSVK